MRNFSPPDGLGPRLAKTRKMAGDLSAYELSTLLGGSPSLVSMIERGDTLDPRGAVLAALANTLGVTTDWLILGAGPEPTPGQVQDAIDQARQRKGADTSLSATGS